LLRHASHVRLLHPGSVSGPRPPRCSSHSSKLLCSIPPRSKSFVCHSYRKHPGVGRDASDPLLASPPLPQSFRPFNLQLSTFQPLPLHATHLHSNPLPPFTSFTSSTSSTSMFFMYTEQRPLSPILSCVYPTFRCITPMCICGELSQVLLSIPVLGQSSIPSHTPSHTSVATKPIVPPTLFRHTPTEFLPVNPSSRPKMATHAKFSFRPARFRAL